MQLEFISSSSLPKCILRFQLLLNGKLSGRHAHSYDRFVVLTI